MCTVIVMYASIRKQCFVCPGSTKGWRAIHSEWFGRVLNTIYIKHETCHIVVVKAEQVCTCRTYECSVLKQYNYNSFWNGAKERIIDRYLLGPWTRSKGFNLSVCHRIMCFAFLSQNIGVSNQKRGFNSNWVIKRVASKMLIHTLVSSEVFKRQKASGARVSLTFMSTPLISILSELNKSAWSFPYNSRLWLLLR